MSLFVFDAVQFNAKDDRVAKVRWGKVKGGEIGPPTWAAEPRIVDVQEVVDALKAGDEVLAIYAVNGHNVMGPDVRIALFNDDFEGIEIVDGDPTIRSLRDLPTF